MTASTTRQKFNKRGFTTLVLFISFLTIVVSGIILYISPRGRTANWTDWSVLFLGKEDWASVHIMGALIMLIIALFHLYFNWPIFMFYFKSRRKAGINLKYEIVAAAALSMILIGGTLAELPPFNQIMKTNESIKNYWEGDGNQAPQAHAEELTFEKFGEQIKKTPDEMAAILREKGYTVDNMESTFGEIAKANKVSPNVLYNAISPGSGHGAGRGGSQREGQAAGPGGGHGRGLGRLTLGQLCEQEGLTLEQAAEILAVKGVDATGEMSFREVADMANMSPADLLEDFRAAANQ